MTPSTTAYLDKALQELNENKNRWVCVDVKTRIGLLRKCQESTLSVAEDMVRAACQAKGIDFNSATSSEEWLGGPMTILRNVRLLIDSLEQIEKIGHPFLSKHKIKQVSDGRVAVEVFPRNFLDKLLYRGFTAQVWMDPQVEPSHIFDSMASIYRKGVKTSGKTALVLGAGNVASIGPMDVLYKLFVENQVCLLKMNPVNDYLGPFIEKSFSPLIEAGYLRLAYGGADVGEYLVGHPVISEIHITGSDKVHDIIVWGLPGEEQERNKKNNTPKLNKRITSELGCVTPIIIVPGSWSESELDFQAQHVATMVANNASFNCNAAKVLVTSADWPQRKTFLEKIQIILKTIPPRKAYYPGSDKKYDHFIAAHPEAEILSEKTPSTLPWTTIFNVSPGYADDPVFKTEAWCSILAETALPTEGPHDFLKKAVRFCNDHVWGTLRCGMIVDPKTRKKLGDNFDRAVEGLRYGSIGINQWPALSYGLVLTTWGAYPEHTLQDIRSGLGVVHNTLMFEHPQKSVVYGPFTMLPKPPWFVTHRNAHRVAKKLTAFEYKPSFSKFLGIVFSALRG